MELVTVTVLAVTMPLLLRHGFIRIADIITTHSTSTEKRKRMHNRKSWLKTYEYTLRYRSSICKSPQHLVSIYTERAFLPLVAVAVKLVVVVGTNSLHNRVPPVESQPMTTRGKRDLHLNNILRVALTHHQNTGTRVPSSIVTTTTTNIIPRFRAHTTAPIPRCATMNTTTPMDQITNHYYGTFYPAHSSCS
jgi:hypothetical protein